jgi:hypothetical protein
MTPHEQRQLIRERFARWTQQLVALQATPIILIGVGHDTPGFHVFVPHRDAPETTLMVQTLRKIADDLEVQGPEETPCP